MLLPHGLVSLWDMLNFHLGNLVHVLWMLGFHERSPVTPAVKKSGTVDFGLLAGIGQSSANQPAVISTDDRRDILEWIEKTQKT
jgi:hypothetical protein